MSFQTFGLSDALLSALQDAGYSQPTPTQAKVLPIALEGQDLVVEAKTGSGKTLAFALALLHKWQTSDPCAPSTLVLCPTRELAEQVAEQIRIVAKHIANFKVLTLFGGVAIGPQLHSMNHLPDVIVGTPGRVIDVITKKSTSLKHIGCFVLDEADRMLDMGFAEQMQWIIKRLKQDKAVFQTLLFSATFGANIASIAKQVSPGAEHISLLQEQVAPSITQIGWQLQDGKKDYAVAALLTEYQPNSAMVFCNTKADVKAIAGYLQDQGFDVAELHGDMIQEARSSALRRFASQCANVLVASDVAARGLDIPDVELVINADVSLDIDTHTHRIGRTGRADKSGQAMTLFTAEQKNHLLKIAEETNAKIPTKHTQALRFHANRIIPATYRGIELGAGKKQKISKGDILGALSKQAEIDGQDIGKIFVTAQSSFVAIKLRSVKRAMKFFKEEKVKGKKLRARLATRVS
ncbi:DEAD/DEAH box helicase [Glaciecola sp. 1036]|uniref:DEAD/DEAH box helicase n=1 Tax=Alteromonadaceae TaxID=72275 RepID=UPI003D0141FD